jgi:EamA domain-containing membrane protein RarD
MTSDKATLLGDPARAGILLVIAASFGFASMDAMSKVLAQDQAILQILWFRCMVFTVFALAIARRRGVRRTLGSQRPWLQAFWALLLVAETPSSCSRSVTCRSRSCMRSAHLPR